MSSSEGVLTGAFIDTQRQHSGETRMIRTFKAVCSERKCAEMEQARIRVARLVNDIRGFGHRNNSSMSREASLATLRKAKGIAARF